jgi:hypothetical protein
VRETPISARRAWWFPAVALAIVLVLTWTPVVAAGVSAAGAQEVSSSSPAASASTPRLAEVATTAKFAAADPQDASLESALPKRIAPVPVVALSAAASADANDKGEASPAKQASRVQTASNTTARPVAATTSATTVTSDSGASEDSRARAILASLISQHPILAGTTVRIGSTPGGYQAVAYYKSGRIVVSPKHTASLERILRHEIWHIIDWRDNGRIDWGESVPPN